MEYYYCDDLTHKQIGEKIGVSGTHASHIRQKALRKLKHPSRSYKMSVARIIANHNEMLQFKDDVINRQSNFIKELSNYVVELAKGKPITEKIQKIIDEQKVTIEEMEFTVRVYNALKRTGINTAECLLEYDSVEKLMQIRNVGKGSLVEVISKMREFGYANWASKIESEMVTKLKKGIYGRGRYGGELAKTSQ